MLIARNGDEFVTATPHAQANCPSCHEPLTAKCGEVLVWHWAHQSGGDCDVWSEGETLWHAAWKNCAPPDRQEVTVESMYGSHRADVIAGDKTVLEIQHSDISTTDVLKREDHYGNMRWLFDVGHREFTLTPLEDVDQPFKWKIHRKHAWHAIGACTKRVMLDFGDEFGVLSCEKVNDSGTYAWGYLYRPNTIARWIAGPDYQPGWDIEKVNT